MVQEGVQQQAQLGADVHGHGIGGQKQQVEVGDQEQQVLETRGSEVRLFSIRVESRGRGYMLSGNGWEDFIVSCILLELVGIGTTNKAQVILISLRDIQWQWQLSNNIIHLL